MQTLILAVSYDKHAARPNTEMYVPLKGPYIHYSRNSKRLVVRQTNVRY